MMKQSGRGICPDFGVVFLTVGLLCLFISGGDVWGQRRGANGNVKQGREIVTAAKNVQKIAETILSDFITQNIPLVAEDIEAIETELAEVDRFRGMFTSEQKAYHFLVQAYLNHYSDGSTKDTMLMVQKAHRADLENEDVTHSLIVLSLYHEKYAIAQKALRELNAGESVVIEAKPEVSDAELSAASHGLDGKNDPNSGPGRHVENQPVVAESKKKSKWSQRSRKKKAGPDMMPGQMLVMPPGVVAPGTKPGSMKKMGAKGKKSKKRRRRGAGKTILKLPTETMPYAYLGKAFQSLNVRNVNGSTYQFDSGQGQVLCALLWTLPDDIGHQRPSRYAKLSLNLDEMPIQDVAYDLWDNVNQFRELYRFYRKSGKTKFITINLDRPTKKNIDQVQGLFADSSWPWINFMAKDTAHVTPWKSKELYTQAFVLVDSRGIIRYMGPVGGFLPLMLLDAQLPQAQAQVSQTSSAVQQQGDFLKNLLDGSAASTKSQSNAVAKPAERSQKNSSEQPISSHQAQQMLELAKVKKRVSQRGALNIYDEVLSQFPDTEQAERARMYIKKICRKNSRIKKDRLKEGKYTGYE